MRINRKQDRKNIKKIIRYLLNNDYLFHSRKYDIVLDIVSTKDVYFRLLIGDYKQNAYDIHWELTNNSPKLFDFVNHEVPVMHIQEELTKQLEVIEELMSHQLT